MAPKQSFWIKVFLTNVLVLIGLLLVVDVLLGIVYSRSKNIKILTYASPDQIQYNYPSKYEPHRYLGYWPIPNYQTKLNKHNTLGFRGEEIIQPKPHNAYRIVCIGGSTTYTSHVDDYQLSYPYLLEKELRQRGFTNCEVINAGAGSWSSWESLINLQFRVLDLQPDLIIVYHSINDIHPRLVWPPSKYRGDNAGRRIAPTITPPSLGNYLLEESNIARTIAVALNLKPSNIHLSTMIGIQKATTFTHLISSF